MATGNVSDFLDLKKELLDLEEVGSADTFLGNLDLAMFFRNC
jgi:hypothetical protein